MLETFDQENNRTIIDNKYYLKCKSSNDAIIYLSSGFDDININFDKSINITHNISEYGFKKYTINLNNNEVYFNITKINKKRNANYIIRYYCPDFLNLSNFDYIYTFDPNNKTINHTFINNETATIYITYNSINVTSYNKWINNKGIHFYVYAFLFKTNENSEKNINTTSILVENKYLFKANTSYYPYLNNQENWILKFENIPRNHNFTYEMQLQVIAMHTYTFDLFPVYYNYYYYENILAFKSEINLTHIGYDELENSKKDRVPTSIIVVVIILLIIIPLMI